MATGYVTLDGDPRVYKFTYTLGPVYEDQAGIQIGWYRNSFQPQPVDATWPASFSVQVGEGQSAQFIGGSYVYTAGATDVTIAVPDEMQTPPVAPRTLEHGKTFMVFYGSVATAITVTRSSNTLVAASSHGLYNGQLVTVASTGTLPAGLTANTLYYVVSRTDTAISLALTAGGSVITISDAGTGTHTVVPFGRVGRYSMARDPQFSNEEPLGIL